MNKYYGKIGFMESVKTDEDSDIYEEQITERYYYGEIAEKGSRWQNSQYLLDDKLVTIKFSIIADPYAYEHFSSIKYIEWYNKKWNVTGIDVQYPRLVLTIGDLYNEQKNSTSI